MRERLSELYATLKEIRDPKGREEVLRGLLAEAGKLLEPLCSSEDPGQREAGWILKGLSLGQLPKALNLEGLLPALAYHAPLAQWMGSPQSSKGALQALAETCLLRGCVHALLALKLLVERGVGETSQFFRGLKLSLLALEDALTYDEVSRTLRAEK